MNLISHFFFFCSSVKHSNSLLLNCNCENDLLKEQKNCLDDGFSFEMCNEFYKIKSLNKSIVIKNESLSKYNIQDILKEAYVDELFVSTCQHCQHNFVDLYSKYIFLNNNHKLSMVFEALSNLNI